MPFDMDQFVTARDWEAWNVFCFDSVSSPNCVLFFDAALHLYPPPAPGWGDSASQHLRVRATREWTHNLTGLYGVLTKLLVRAENLHESSELAKPSRWCSETSLNTVRLLQQSNGAQGKGRWPGRRDREQDDGGSRKKELVEEGTKEEAA